MTRVGLRRIKLKEKEVIPVSPCCRIPFMGCSRDDSITEMEDRGVGGMTAGPGGGSVALHPDILVLMGVCSRRAVPGTRAVLVPTNYMETGICLGTRCPHLLDVHKMQQCVGRGYGDGSPCLWPGLLDSVLIVGKNDKLF